jgi:hypothetical protein
MSWVALVQLASACVGVIASLFFAIGIMRQSVEAMARLSGSYWHSNPHMPPALAAQKADYLFGGGLIFVAFVLQFVSFVVPAERVALSASGAAYAPWLAAGLTVAGFFMLRVLSTRLAVHYERQINVWLEQQRGNASGT